MTVEEIILNNHNLIYLVLKQLNLYSKLDEYYDIAVIGLVKGAKTYNPNFKIKVSTYLCKCIRMEILTEIRKQHSVKRGVGCTTLSLDSEEYATKEGKSSTLLDAIPSNTCIEEELINETQLKEIYKCIESLDTRKKFIIYSSYGVNGYECLTQQKIAAKLKCSQAQVSRIRSKAISEIKEKMKEW